MRLSYLLLAFVIGVFPALAETRVPQSKAEISLSFAPLVKKAAPAVVNIFANRVVEKSDSPFGNDPLFKGFFGRFARPEPRVQNSLGSGVIVSDDGIVVSNYHVVAMATQIRVVLADRREYQARILLSDQDSDLAILKIDNDTPLPVLPLRDSDSVEVGDLALAIGNPFGIGQTVTSGIVSGLARSGAVTGNARGYFLQTDAAINPGNSGGALIDINGQLIGINTSILTQSGGSNGVGFAIPANLVARYVEQASAGHKSFRRPCAGVLGQSVDAVMAQKAGLSVPEGVVLSALHDASPFAGAGLKADDIVLRVDGYEVNSPVEMLFRMSVRAIGETLDVVALSEGQEKTVQVDLIEAPDVPARDVRVMTVGPLEGLEVSNLNPAVQSELNLPAVPEQGVVATQVPDVLQHLGLREGDVVVAINGNDILSTSDVEGVSRQQVRAWRIDGMRNGQGFMYRFRF